MKRFLLTAVAVLAPYVALAGGEVGDLGTGSGNLPPDYGNTLFGLPAFAWWAIGVLGATALILWLSRFWTWLHERLNEPSTHLALAVFLGMTGLFINSLSLDPSAMAQGFLLAGAVFAFLGLIGKDKEGPLL